VDREPCSVDLVEDVCRELQDRFQLAGLSISTGCEPGHEHDGSSCGLDLTAHEPNAPHSLAEFVTQAREVGSVDRSASVWASGGCARTVARLAAAYLVLVDDPRLGRVIDYLQAGELCFDCDRPCTIDQGVHSTQRAVLCFECGTAERGVACLLMSSWAGTGAHLLAAVRATLR
jgi:hypothetical protein